MHNDGDGEFESKEAGGVVDEAFALENVDDALREADALGDGGGGDGVGGRDDGAENEAQPPVKTGEDAGGGPSHAEHSEGDKAKGEKEDADQVEFKIAPGGQPSCGVQKRGQDDEKNHVGIQGDCGDAGNEADEQTGDDEDDGIRRLEFARESGENDDEEKEEEKDNFDLVDAAALQHFREDSFRFKSTTKTVGSTTRGSAASELRAGNSDTGRGLRRRCRPKGTALHAEARRTVPPFNPFDGCAQLPYISIVLEI